MLTSADTEPTGLSILIVDDEDSTRRLCRDIAVDAALQAHTTGTTEQALELLEETPVDIVLTDLKVPEVGGMELLKLIRSKYPHVAVMCSRNSAVLKRQSQPHASVHWITSPNLFMLMNCGENSRS